MKSITPTRLALARRRTMIAVDDYSKFSDSELIEETMSLHATLAGAAGFGRLAELGIRHTAIERLLLIDAEHQRRTQPTAA